MEARGKWNGRELALARGRFISRESLPQVFNSIVFSYRDGRLLAATISRDLDLCRPKRCLDRRYYCFTSKRLAGDQLPGVPEAELARTRHHIVVVGSVLVVNCETVISRLTTCGAVNELSLSIWIV